MGEELIKILNMIEKRTITPEEGQQLIEVIETANQKVTDVNLSTTGRFLHIDVDSYEKQEMEAIEINLPFNLVKSVLKMGFIQKQIKEHTESNIELDLDGLIHLLDIDYSGDLVMIDNSSVNIQIWID